MCASSAPRITRPAARYASSALRAITGRMGASTIVQHAHRGRPPRAVAPRAPIVRKATMQAHRDPSLVLRAEHASIHRRLVGLAIEIHWIASRSTDALPAHSPTAQAALCAQSHRWASTQASERRRRHSVLQASTAVRRADPIHLALAAAQLDTFVQLAPPHRRNSRAPRARTTASPEAGATIAAL
jgi:hypothetical protein